MVLVSLFAGMLCGCWFLDKHNFITIDRFSIETLKLMLMRSFRVLMFLTLAGYLIWFMPVFLDPQKIVTMFSEHAYNIRGSVSTIPGVSTLTQFGPVLSINIALLNGFKLLKKKRHRFYILLFILLVLMRTVLWSERLALLEIIIPYVVAYYPFVRASSCLQWWYRKGAILLIPAVILLFGIFEYFRSWNFYKDSYDSYLSFLLQRFSAYYSISINNGIGFLEEYNEWPYFIGAYSFDFLYKLPFFNFFRNEYERIAESYGTFLYLFARPEYTNQTALFSIVADFGFLISSMLYFVYGTVLGALFVGYRRQALFAIFIFPVGILSLYEIFRISYLSTSRSTYVIIGIIYLYINGTLFIRGLRRKSAISRI